mmetsp:Transcript_66329/g.209665  ORF Transcript_66329/g.209665 Transcript_66329/m.209665 type:complete len:204 (-) Transcript_66329:1067-1678(-)
MTLSTRASAVSSHSRCIAASRMCAERSAHSSLRTLRPLHILWILSAAALASSSFLRSPRILKVLLRASCAGVYRSVKSLCRVCFPRTMLWIIVVRPLRLRYARRASHPRACRWTSTAHESRYGLTWVLWSHTALSSSSTICASGVPRGMLADRRGSCPMDPTYSPWAAIWRSRTRSTCDNFFIRRRCAAASSSSPGSETRRPG